MSGAFRHVLAGHAESDHVELLLAHWELVKQWNRKTNLTAITGDEDAAHDHYLDSLALRDHLHEGAILDVGSGAGYPGVPLAIVTGAPTTLLEPRSKRVSFLKLVKARLGLANVTVLEGRSTDPPSGAFENLVTRATFSARDDLMACGAWLRPEGRLLALRTEPSKPPAPEIVPYRIREKNRVIEVWQTPDLSGP